MMGQEQCLQSTYQTFSVGNWPFLDFKGYLRRILVTDFFIKFYGTLNKASIVLEKYLLYENVT